MSQFQKCPGCGKRGVSFRLRAGGEDHFGCRYCGWHAFTQGNAPCDRMALAQLQAINQELESGD